MFSPPRGLFSGRFWQVRAVGDCQQGAASRDQSQQHGNGSRGVRGPWTRPAGTRVASASPSARRGRPDHRQREGALSRPPCRLLGRRQASRAAARTGLWLRWAPAGWGESPPARLALPPSSHVTPERSPRVLRPRPSSGDPTDRVRWGPRRRGDAHRHMLDDRWPNQNPLPPPVSVSLRALPRGCGGEREATVDSGEGARWVHWAQGQDRRRPVFTPTSGRAPQDSGQGPRSPR